ncbi:MAG: HAD-IA family hydrolase [Patescibacteria group bacterium]|jgi:HAD superfamily hydrolase (TIGR01509 family)
MGKISAVIFDLGGVYFVDGGKHVYNFLKETKNYDEQLLKKVLKSEMRKDALRGKITDQNFWKWAKEILPSYYDIEFISRAYYDSYKQDEDIKKLIIELRTKNYKIIAFSGNMKERLKFLQDKYDFYKLFDTSIYSCEVGYTKPDSEFYETLVNSLGCTAEEAYFIDDQQHNVDYVLNRYNMKGCVYITGKIADLRENLKQQGIL